MRNWPAFTLLPFALLSLLLAGAPARCAAEPEAAFDHFRDTVHARIEAQKRVIEQDPGNAQAHFQLGLSYMALGRHREEIAAYEEAVRLKPDFADAYYNLGAAWDLLGDGERAKLNIRRALHWYTALRNHPASRRTLRELRRLENKYRQEPDETMEAPREKDR